MVGLATRAFISPKANLSLNVSPVMGVGDWKTRVELME